MQKLTLTANKDIQEKIKNKITQIKKNKDEVKNWKIINTNIQKICSAFPKAFNLKSPKPLERGVLEKLFQQAEKTGLSKTAIRNMLTAYTRREKYLHAVIKESQRINITGQKVQEILQEEKIFSQNLIKKRETTE